MHTELVIPYEVIEALDNGTPHAALDALAPGHRDALGSALRELQLSQVARKRSGDAANLTLWPTLPDRVTLGLCQLIVQIGGDVTIHPKLGLAIDPDGPVPDALGLAPRTIETYSVPPEGATPEEIEAFVPELLESHPETWLERDAFWNWNTRSGWVALWGRNKFTRRPLATMGEALAAGLTVVWQPEAPAE